MVLELSIEGRPFIEGLEEVLRQQPPPRTPDLSYLEGISISMSGGTAVKLWNDYGWTVEVTVPFPSGTYEGKRLAKGLIGLTRLKPSLMGMIAVRVGEDPTLYFSYAKQSGQMLGKADVNAISEWLGWSLRTGVEEPYCRIYDDGSYDLALALEVKGKDAGDRAVAALRERLSREAELRGIPVSLNGNHISFDSNPHTIIDEALIAEEVARRPKSICLYGYDIAKPAIIRSVLATEDNLELTIHPELVKKMPFGFMLKNQDGLRALWEGQLKALLEEATSAPLTAQLQQPWNLTYHFLSLADIMNRDSW